MRSLLLIFCILISSAKIFAQSGWFQQTSDPSYQLNDVHFINEQTGIAVGGLFNQRSAVIIINDGITWIDRSPNFPTNNVIYSVFMLNENLIYASGVGGIFRSTDGANSWTTQFANLDIQDIYFVNTLTGYAVGYDNNSSKVFKTENGVTWSEIGNLGAQILSIFFINQATGFATGYEGYIYKTTNGGSNWDIRYQDLGNILIDLFFVNNLGFACGNNRQVVRSTDLGEHWGLIDDFKSENISFSSIFFTSESKGYVCGDKGVIYSTTNSGSNWSKQRDSVGTTLTSIYFPNENTGYAVGTIGIVLKTTNSGVNINQISNHVPDKMELLQNFPNPFNPETKIFFKISEASDIRIEIYNIVGERIFSSPNEKLLPGSYSFVWNGKNSPSGVYFYSLITEKSTETRKMILLK